MHSVVQSCREAWFSIQAHRLRSFLTTLGIIIGVASVITVVSMVQGLAHSITQNFDGLGANSLTVRSDTPFEEQLQGKVNRLSMADYRTLMRRLDGVEDVSPSFSPYGPFGTMARHGSSSAFTRVFAVTAEYEQTYKIYPRLGRFISDADDGSRRKVVVVGQKTKENLKLPADPVGEFLNVGGEWFKIIGVMEERGELFGVSQDDYLLIPFTTGEAVSAAEAEQDITIAMNVPDLDQMEAVQGRITQILRQAHGLKPGERSDFKAQTAQQLTESISKVTDSLTFALGGIVAISLLVGGIGVMNIMLVSVRERTREIGICKALGAQRHDILMQFLIEATMLSLLGGLVGLFLGWLLGVVAAVMSPGLPEAIIPVWAAVLAVGFSATIGIVFGVAPAAQAASLNPIDALRYE